MPEDEITDYNVPMAGVDGKRYTLAEAYEALRDPEIYRQTLKFSRMYQAKALQQLLDQFEREERARDPASWTRIMEGVRAINARIPAFRGHERDPGLAVKLWLDDLRDHPDEGWVRVRTPEEAIEILKAGSVIELSLDHDLGLTDPDGRERTGYDVLVFIERELARGSISFQLPLIQIHSANSVGRQRMERAITSIQRLDQGRRQA